MLDLSCLSSISTEGFVTGTILISTLVSKGSLISVFKITCLWLILISLKFRQSCKCSMRFCLVKQFLAAYFEENVLKKKKV